jgi:hypothetical protein
MLLQFNPKVDHLKCVVLTPKEGLVLTRNMVRLLPGTNEVTNDEWKAMRGNITNELDSGEIRILAQKVSDGRGNVGGRKAKDLKDMPVNIAIKYVSECNNPDTLEKWYKEITKEEVRLAITKKLKKLGLELPEDEVPDAPNGSPMSLDEFDEDEKGDGNLLDDSDDEDDSDEDKKDSNEDGGSEDEDYSQMTNKELKAKCEELGIDTKELSKKQDFIDALENHSEE